VKDLQVHDRQYRSRLGDDKLDNLVTLCAYCHMEEHGQLAYSEAAILQMRVRQAVTTSESEPLLPG